MKWILFSLVFLVACTSQAEVPGMADMPMGQNGMHSGGHMMSPITSEEQFVVEMIPHHQEAVDSSRIVLASTENAALQNLLERIIVAQETEIAMMNVWVDEWYEGGYEAEYVNMMSDLESLEGVEQENRYLEDMIMHHMMAVMMARQVLALEPREEVAEFARGVIEVQSAEIAEMRGLIRS